MKLRVSAMMSKDVFLPYAETAMCHRMLADPIVPKDIGKRGALQRKVFKNKELHDYEEVRRERGLHPIGQDGRKAD